MGIQTNLYVKTMDVILAILWNDKII